jgi:glutamate synthase (NADPH/NADH) small chain
LALRPETATGGGLTADQIEANFADLAPLLEPHQAKTEADRCLYCYDAPCIEACPTGIDVPTFIHQIRSGNLRGSAETILSANIFGGACGRACPTEVLCEQACVMNKKGEEPIRIGALQRHAVEKLIDQGGPHPFHRAPPTGKRLAVVGAGPAGLSFAHRAALLGHTVVVYEAKPKPGGLNEYGLAAYKMAGDFAARETAFVLDVGGVTVEYGKALGRELTLTELRNHHDAVFLGVGLGGSRRLDIPGEALDGMIDALDFIAGLRQARSKAGLPIGRSVVVIGGGNTAVDAAIQAKRLGAERVVMAYRRGEAEMSATAWERDLARLNGVEIRLWAVPTAIEGEERVQGVSFAESRIVDGKLQLTGETFIIEADMVLRAIGQLLSPAGLDGLNVTAGKIDIDEAYRTTLPGVFAGGDCVATGEDLTVRSVEDGKQAAIACDLWLKGAD